MRVIAVVLVSVAMLGCRGPSDAQPPDPTQPADTASESDRTTTTLTIVVRGPDTPLRSGHVGIQRANYVAPVLEAELPSDGRLTVELPCPAVFTMQLEGADHYTSYLTIATREPTAELTARLGTDQSKPDIGIRGAALYPGYQAQMVLRGFRDPIVALLQSQGPELDIPAIADDVAVIAEAARAEVEAIDDPALKRAATIEYLNFAAPMIRSQFLDAQALAWVFERIPADDPYWTFMTGRLASILGLEAPIIQAHLAAMAEHQTDPGLLAELAYIELLAADQRGDEAAVAALYSRLASDYPGTTSLLNAGARFDPERPLMPGKPMPEWSFVSLDGATRISSAEREGQAYLLDIWSTWCGPCVADMPDLHAAHAALIEAGTPIEFIGLSMDHAAEDVAKLRDQWPMPWTHAWVAPDEQMPLHRRWTFTAIPTVILVDEHGTIVAVNESLRGDELLPTLLDFTSARPRTASPADR